MIIRRPKFLSYSLTHAVDIPHNIVDLRDTPTGYDGYKYLRSTTSGAEWIAIEDFHYTKDEIDTISGSIIGKIPVIVEEEIVSTSFLDLYDTPDDYENGKVLVSTSSGIEWSGNIYGNGDKDIHILFGDGSSYKTTGTNKSWTTSRQFIFRGSNILGEPVSCKIVAWVANDNYPGSIRLCNFDTGEVITEWIDFENEEPEIKTNTNLINIPTQESILCIDYKAGDTGESKVVYISSFLMTF